MPIIYIFLSVVVVSALSFVGVLSLAISVNKLKEIIIFLVSLSAGSLLGGAALHLLPEVISGCGSTTAIWYYFLAGIIIFFILEKLICWRHCHIQTSGEHPHHLGLMNLIGDGLHNFIDGMVITGAFLVNSHLGLITTIAVIAHEIPQEIGDFGVLIHAGYSRSKALFLNFLIALTAIFGAGLALLIGRQTENFTAVILPFTAGSFIYIATADLIPELKKDNRLLKSLGQLGSILLGVGIMLLMKIFFSE